MGVDQEGQNYSQEDFFEVRTYIRKRRISRDEISRTIEETLGQKVTPREISAFLRVPGLQRCGGVLVEWYRRQKDQDGGPEKSLPNVNLIEEERNRVIRTRAFWREQLERARRNSSMATVQMYANLLRGDALSVISISNTGASECDFVRKGSQARQGKS